MHNPIFKKLLRIIAYLILSLVPSILVIVGSYLIALGSTNFLSELLNVNFPLRNHLPLSYYVYLGLFIILISLIGAFFLSKKGISPFGWITSLLIQAIFITFFLTLFASPLFHFLIVNYLFKFGLCQWMTVTVETRVNNQYKQEALENTKQFCTAGSKLFNFSYP